MKCVKRHTRPVVKFCLYIVTNDAKFMMFEKFF